MPGAAMKSAAAPPAGETGLRWSRWLRARFAARADSEHEQAIVRLVIGGLISGYFLVHLGWGDRDAAISALGTYWWPFMAMTAALFAHIVARPRVYPARRVVGICLDLGTLTAALVLSGRFAAVLVFIYAWVIVGNGMRYGPRYMWASCAIALCGFTIVVTLNDYWVAVPELAFTLGAFLVVVPAYVGVLLARLQRANTQLGEQARRLEQLATHDALTGLPNRALAFDRLTQMTSLCNRTGKHIGILYFDLDGFKRINDEHGHHVGDELLVQVGTRLAKVLRSHDTLARIGGDEFVIFLNQIPFPEGVERVACAVVSEVEAIAEIAGVPIDVSASVGISCWPLPDARSSPEDALRLADAAMYAAKRAGKGRWVLSDGLSLELARPPEASEPIASRA
jgi:diguanylate cyclase (GGDEF)-like protein